MLGAEIDLGKLRHRPDFELFGETQSRVIVSVRTDRFEDLLRAARAHTIDARHIGCVTDGGRLTIDGNGERLVDASVAELQHVYENAIAIKLGESVSHAPKSTTAGPTRYGDGIFLLGAQYSDEVGGSVYLSEVTGKVTGDAPRIDLGYAARLNQLLAELAREKIALSAHDCAEGGLGVAIAECLI